MTDQKILTPEEHEMMHGVGPACAAPTVQVNFPKAPKPERLTLSGGIPEDFLEWFQDTLLRDVIIGPTQFMAAMTDEETEEALARIYNRYMGRPYSYGLGATPRELREAIDAEGFVLVKKPSGVTVEF